MLWLFMQQTSYYMVAGAYTQILALYDVRALGPILTALELRYHTVPISGTWRLPTCNKYIVHVTANNKAGQRPMNHFKMMTARKGV